MSQADSATVHMYLYYNILFRAFLKKKKELQPRKRPILISSMYIVELTAYKFGSHFIGNAVFETGRCHAFALFLTANMFESGLRPTP